MPSVFRSERDLGAGLAGQVKVMLHGRLIFFLFGGLECSYGQDWYHFGSQSCWASENSSVGRIITLASWIYIRKP